MKYNLEKIDKKKNNSYCGCSVGQKAIYLSKDLKEKIKDDRCNLFVDAKNKVISFFSAKNGRYKLTKQGKGFIVNCEISDKMEIGRYVFVEDLEGNIICKK